MDDVSRKYPLESANLAPTEIEAVSRAEQARLLSVLLLAVDSP